MNWKNIELYNLPDNFRCFWRYEFEDGDVRYFCHEIYRVRYDVKIGNLGKIKYVHYVDPREIKL